MVFLGPDMSDKDKYCEVIELAIEREVQAYLMYTTLAGMMINKGMRSLFMAMAAEELGHKANLELEMMKLGRVVPNEPIKANYKELTEAERSVDGIDMEYKDAILLAVQKEDAAFQLYSELALNSDNAETRNMFLEMAEQEMKHKMRFQEEYENIISDEK